jgi:hypothetical protein
MVMVIAAVAAAAVAPAHAQGYGPGHYAGPPPPPRGVVRSGFIAGLGIGAGAFGLQDCEPCDGTGGLALRGHIGGMVARNVALVLDVESVIGPFNADDLDEDIVITHSIMLAAARVWLGARFYLQGGLGLGWVRLSDAGGNIAVTSDAGGALMLGAGLELWQRPSFTIDLALRLFATRYGNDDQDGFGIAGGTLLVGFNWY